MSHSNSNSSIESKSLNSSSISYPYYYSDEVSSHNLSTDCWVSYFNKVYNLTSLIQSSPSTLTAPLIKFAGSDISHWFNPHTQEPITHIDSITGYNNLYLPYGRYVDIPPNTPDSNYDSTNILPWWRNAATYQCGLLSQRARSLYICNILTGQKDLLKVCTEETLNDILRRYSKYNSHAASYTWKRLGRVLDMNLTLDGNGILDETEELAKYNLNEEDFIPAIHIYFNDDLTTD